MNTIAGAKSLVLGMLITCCILIAPFIMFALAWAIPALFLGVFVVHGLYEYYTEESKNPPK